MGATGQRTADWDALLLQSSDLVRSVRGAQGCTCGSLGPPRAGAAGHSGLVQVLTAASPRPWIVLWLQEAAFPRVQRDILQVGQGELAGVQKHTCTHALHPCRQLRPVWSRLSARQASQLQVKFTARTGVCAMSSSTSVVGTAAALLHSP